ncbi:hypothetical protein KOI35_30235 [Actinoplanes bogorensis]|uniref:Membrane-associated oxidoreductase n=1 Tax=Paractinoplanes bogorensis TaxID=1610840 RepID=A0ABS5YWI2_9ACTN|nr:hypothetical protein [Actinoplanes bogorensis]MBU2667798.1 hypothetical protein [Actinoplanes bogorensis]
MSPFLPLRPDQDLVPQLLAASRAGRSLTCAGADVNAADLRSACLAGEGLDPYGLRLDRARIVGPLDLRACEVAVPLAFTSCDFTEPIDVRGAHLHDLSITADPTLRPYVLPGMLATGCRIDRDLDVSGMVITGELAARPGGSTRASVWLIEAELGGSIVARGTHVLPSTGFAINADRVRVDGAILLPDGFRATGEVRFGAARVNGSLDLIGAQLTSGDGRALNLASASIGGSVFVLDSAKTKEPSRIRGRIDMNHTAIGGTFFMRNAQLTAPPSGVGAHPYNIATPMSRPLLFASQLSVRGAMRIEGDTVVRGGLLLTGARLEGGLRVEGSVWNPGDIAVDLAQAGIGGIEAADVSIEGTVKLDNAQVDGPVRFDGASFTTPRQRRCISAVGIRIQGDLRLAGVNAVGGGLNFRGASVGGVVDAADAYISNPGDKTLSLHMAEVSGNVRICGKFRSIGLVVLNRAVVGGRLRADGAVLEWRPAGLEPPGEPNPRGVALEALAADVRSGLLLGWTIKAGGIDLTDATTTALADRPESDWPVTSYLGGFRYDRFAPVDWESGRAVWDADERIAWLARMRPFDPRAWQHLATVLRTAGDRDGADAVEIAALRQARAGRPRRARAIDRLQDTTVRYGFRPQRAIYLLILLIAAVTLSLYLPAVRDQLRATDDNAVVFSPDGARPLPGEAPRPGTCGDGKVRCLSPLFYAIDTVVPLIDLHQRSTWYPVGEGHGPWLEWWLNLCTILGWVTSTVFAFSFTRLGSRT